MKVNFYHFSIAFFLVLFFIAPVFVFGEENNYNFEKVFYLASDREKQAITAIENNPNKIDILAPQAYAVGSDLQLRGSLSAELKEVIEKYDIRVMPLVVNAKFNQNIIHNFLLSTSAQDKVIDNFIFLAEKNNYIGWQFDFENISYLDRDLYSSFVEKTAKALHKNNLILSVAAVCRIVDYEDTAAYKNWAGAFDYKRLAEAVDFISMMTYDDSNSVGPTASVLYINNVLDYVKDKIPAEKLSMGIPFYYWGWDQNSYKRISSGPYSLVDYTAQNFRCKHGFDERLGVPWLTYSVGAKSYKIWYENEKSFGLKLDIVKEKNLRGFSAWVLGSEDPEIWSALD